MTYRVPKRIPSNGSANVTKALRRFIRNVPNGSRILFRWKGIYRVEGSLRIKGRWGLTFAGNGATIIATKPRDRDRRHLWFIGGGNLTVRNLTVRGANSKAGLSDAAWNPDYEFQHAFALQGVQGALLENVRAYDVYGDFVYIGPKNLGSGVFEPSRNIIVRDSRFKRNGRHGICICAAEDVLVESNFIGKIRRATFNVEPTVRSWVVRRVRIVGNRTGPGRLRWLANAGAGFEHSDIQVIGNVARASAGPPIIDVKNPSSLGVRGPYLVEDNIFVVKGSPRAGFDFRGGVQGITLRYNTVEFPSERSMTAVRLVDSHTVRVHDNAFPGAATVLSADESSDDVAEWDNTT